MSPRNIDYSFKILEEILTRFRSEAKMLSIMEYDKELHEQTIIAIAGYNCKSN